MKAMSLKRIIRSAISKRGDYVIEATLILPIFIIATVTIMSIVPIIGTFENINYSAVDEMRFEVIKSHFRDNPVALPLKTKSRIKSENSWLNSVHIMEYRRNYSDNNIDNLQKIWIRATITDRLIFGLFKKVKYDEVVVARAYKGSYTKFTPDKNQVIIFPEWGKKYHNDSCRYVKASCELKYLTKSLAKDYLPCKLCHAASAQLGSPVFCFNKSGKVYHIQNCKIVEKYYIWVGKRDAMSRNYTPCSKCGGD